MALRRRERTRRDSRLPRPSLEEIRVHSTDAAIVVQVLVRTGPIAFASRALDTRRGAVGRCRANAVQRHVTVSISAFSLSRPIGCLRIASSHRA